MSDYGSRARFFFVSKCWHGGWNLSFAHQIKLPGHEKGFLWAGRLTQVERNRGTCVSVCSSHFRFLTCCSSSLKWTLGSQFVHRYWRPRHWGVRLFAPRLKWNRHFEGIDEALPCWSHRCCPCQSRRRQSASGFPKGSYSSRGRQRWILCNR